MSDGLKNIKSLFRIRLVIRIRDCEMRIYNKCGFSDSGKSGYFPITNRHKCYARNTYWCRSVVGEKHKKKKNKKTDGNSTRNIIISLLNTTFYSVNAVWVKNIRA